MYQFLKGIIIEKTSEQAGSEKVILEVNGVGFEIQTTLSSLNSLSKKGEVATVYTTLIHKEDGMTLIGFPTLLERELFNLLISVSGIGPKTALNLLNNLTVSEISYAILNNDAPILCKAQGIGEKTASRMVLELKEKVSKWDMLPIAYSKNREQRTEDRGQNNFSVQTEAKSVLQSLGYSTSEISQAFTEAKANGNHKDTETIVQFCLKWLATIKK